MKFSVGDPVWLTKTGAEGRVVGIINDEMVEVEIDGSHFPAFVDEMEHPYLRWFLEKKKKKPAPSFLSDSPLPPPDNRDLKETGIYLSFLPVFRFDGFEDLIDRFKIYIINQTAQQLALQYECGLRDSIVFRHGTTLDSGMHFYLHDLTFDQAGDHPRFSYSLISDAPSESPMMWRNRLRLRPKKLFEYVSKLQQANDPMFSILLEKVRPPENDVSGSIAEKVIPRARPRAAGRGSRPRRPEAIDTLDLHLERLAPEAVGRSSFEILQLQLQALAAAIDTAVSLNQQSMIVIHGVGSGVLKSEVHALLRAHPAVAFFVHDWRPRYGYGATEIFFD